MHIVFSAMEILKIQ